MKQYHPHKPKHRIDQGDDLTAWVTPAPVTRARCIWPVSRRCSAPCCPKHQPDAYAQAGGSHAGVPDTADLDC